MCLPHDVVAVTIAIAPMFFGRVSDLRIRLNQNFLERSPKIWFTHTQVHKYTQIHTYTSAKRPSHRNVKLCYVYKSYCYKITHITWCVAILWLVSDLSTALSACKFFINKQMMKMAKMKRT